VNAAGVILSAGASRRMGTPKALLLYEGETFLDRIARLFLEHCGPVVVVLGHHASRIVQEVRCSRKVIFAHNSDPDRGMLTSLQCGLATLPPETRRALFTPVDLPAILPSTIPRLLAEPADVVAPAWMGRRGHPVCISPAVIAAILALPPEAQARDAIRRFAAQTVEVDDPGVVNDIDDPAAYRRLLESAAP